MKRANNVAVMTLTTRLAMKIISSSRMITHWILRKTWTTIWRNWKRLISKRVLRVLRRRRNNLMVLIAIIKVLMVRIAFRISVNHLAKRILLMLLRRLMGKMMRTF